MRPIQKTIAYLTAAPAGVATAQTPAPVTNGLAKSQTVADNASLTLDGGFVLAGVGYFYFPVVVTLTSASNFSATTFTVVGTDVNGDPLTENVTGPNNSTVSTTAEFASVTSIDSDASGYTVETITAGAVYSYLTNDGSFAVGGIATATPVPAPVTLTSTSNLSAFTFEVQGYDVNGNLLIETLSGPNNNTVSGTLLFKEIFGIATNAAGLTVETVSAGFGNAGDFGTGAWWPLDIYVPNQVTTISVNELDGAITYSVEYTNEDPFDTSITQLAVAHPATGGAFTAATTDQTHSTTVLMRAVRVKFTAGSGTARVTVVQQSTQ